MNPSQMMNNPQPETNLSDQARTMTKIEGTISVPMLNPANPQSLPNDFQSNSMFGDKNKRIGPFEGLQQPRPLRPSVSISSYINNT
jgi:hypothetical protein